MTVEEFVTTQALAPSSWWGKGAISKKSIDQGYIAQPRLPSLGTKERKKRMCVCFDIRVRSSLLFAIMAGPMALDEALQAKHNV